MFFGQITGIFLLLYFGQFSFSLPVENTKNKDYGDVTYKINFDQNAQAGKEIAIGLPAADSHGGSSNEARLWTGRAPDHDGTYRRTQAEVTTDRDEITADAQSRKESKPPENMEVTEREGRTLYESVSYPSHILSVETEEMSKREREETVPEDQDKDPSREEKDILNVSTEVSEKQMSHDGSESNSGSGVGDTNSEDIQNDYNEYGARGGGIPNHMIHLGYDKGNNRESPGPVSGTVYQLVGAGGLTTEDGKPGYSGNQPRLNQVIPTRTGYAVHTKPGFDTNDPLPVNTHRYSTSHSAGNSGGSHLSPSNQKRHGGRALLPVQNAPPRYSYQNRNKKYARRRPGYFSKGRSYSNSPSYSSKYSSSYPTYSGAPSSKTNSGYGYPSDSSSSYKSPNNYAPSSGTNYPPSVYSSVSDSSNTYPGSGTYSDSFASYKPSDSYSNSPSYSQNPSPSYSNSYSSSPSYSSSSSYPESKSYDGSHQTSSSGHGSYPSSSSSYHSMFKSYPKNSGSPNNHDSVSSSYPSGSGSYSFGSSSFPSSGGSHSAVRYAHQVPSTHYSNPSSSSLYSSQSQYSPPYSSRSGSNRGGVSYPSHSTSYQKPRTSHSQSYSSSPGHSYSKHGATNSPQQYYNSYSRQQPRNEQTHSYNSYKTPSSGYSSHGEYSNSEPTRYYDASVQVRGKEENTVQKDNQSENKDKVIEDETDTSADNTPGRTKRAVSDELQPLDDPDAVDQPLDDYVGQPLNDGYGGYGGGGYGGHGGGHGGYGGGGHHGGGGGHYGAYGGNEHGNFGGDDGGGHQTDGQHYGGTQYGGSSKHDASRKWYGGTHSNGHGKHGSHGHFNKHYHAGHHGQYKKGHQDHYKHHGGKVKTYTYGGHGWYKEQTHGYHQGHGGEHGHKKGHNGGHKHGKHGHKESPYWSASEHFGGWKQSHGHN